jgi:hypothetical protein
LVFINQVDGLLGPKSNRRLVMTLIKEEIRVYSLYTCGIGGGFRSQERCYEILNERRTTRQTNSRYLQKEHYYKIKW